MTSLDESSLTSLLVLADMVASKLENNDILMKVLARAQVDASKLEYENDKLRDLAQRLYGFAYDEYSESTELNFADELRELGIEVKTDEDW